jgi:hypothetical protein
MSHAMMQINLLPPYGSSISRKAGELVDIKVLRKAI